MSGWLSRARDALSGRAAEIVPEPIQIPCPCGRTIETTRRESFQRVLCKTCGEPFFILPLDVYPRPLMKKVRPAKAPKPQRSTKSPASPDELVAKNASQSSSAATQPTSEVDSPQASFSQSVQQTLWQTGQTLRRQFTSLRIVVLSLLLVLGLTGWWQWSRAALSRAESDYTAAVEAGTAALQKKDLLSAAKEFERAAHAVDLLHRTDIAAEQARQQHRELTAINALLQASLPDILVSARQAKQKTDAAAAESDFAHLHIGRWVVLQTEITRSSADNAALSWEQRVQIDDDALSLAVSLPAFSKIPTKPPPPVQPVAGEPVEAKDRDAANVNQNEANNADPNVNDSEQREIIFAAQIKSLRWNVQKSQWDLDLNPTTGFLWANFDLLIAAGLVPDEIRTEAQLRALLLEQSRWIGVAP